MDDVEFDAETLLRLSEAFKEDPGNLHPELRRAIYKHFLEIDFQPPNDHYIRYSHISEPYSIAEDEWPIDTALARASQFRRGYIDPVELSSRLATLKPSHNFELRLSGITFDYFGKTPTARTPGMGYIPTPIWVSETRRAVHFSKVERKPYEILEPIEEALLARHVNMVNHVRNTVSGPLLIRHVSQADDGTPYPRYLRAGLHRLFVEWRSAAGEIYKEEYQLAEQEKLRAIRTWKEQHADIPLEPDLLSQYVSWPSKLVALLYDIDETSMTRARKRHITTAREHEKKLSSLISWWTHCGLIDGTISPQPSWMLCTWYKREPRPYRFGKWPYHLLRRIQATSSHGEDWELGVLLEIARFKESFFSTGKYPSTALIELPEQLKDKCTQIWQQKGDMDYEIVETQVIDAMREWRIEHGQVSIRRSRKASAQTVDGLAGHNTIANGWEGRLRPRTGPETITTLNKQSKNSRRQQSPELEKSPVLKPKTTSIRKSRSRQTISQLQPPLNPTSEARLNSSISSTSSENIVLQNKITVKSIAQQESDSNTNRSSKMTAAPSSKVGSATRTLRSRCRIVR